MNTNDDQWWDAQSGEYVLGTLRGVERDVFERILESDHDAQARVDYWSRYLSELDSDIQATKPPENILPKILHRIHAKDTNVQTSELSSANEIHDLTSDWSRDLDETLDANTNYAPVDVDKAAEQHHKRRVKQVSIRLWKTLSLLSIAAVFALTAILFTLFDINKKLISGAQANGVGIVQNTEQEALWIITLYKDSSKATVVAVAPPEIASSYKHQLWAVLPDDSGVSPLGQLPRNSGEGSTIELSTPSRHYAEFAVSLEPTAEFAPSVPSGPVLFSGTIQPLVFSNR